MRLYSYVVAYDYGFAPNPFYGTCTLATCKPVIRRVAEVGDMILGTGSAHYSLSGQLVFFMQVSEILTYQEYWSHPEFQKKKPNLRGSLKQAFGDNIYHRDLQTGDWIQENSHHSLPDGNTNFSNLDHDTQTPKVLLGRRFAYWGRSGPTVPARLREVVHGTRAHRSRFPEDLIKSLAEWLESRPESGYCGAPAEFARLLDRN